MEHVGIMTFTITDDDPIVYVYDRINESFGGYAAAFERDTLAVTRLIPLADVSEEVRINIVDRLVGYNESDVKVFSRGRVDCEEDACTYTFEGYQVYAGKDVLYVAEKDGDYVLDRLNEFLDETKEWVI